MRLSHYHRLLIVFGNEIKSCKLQITEQFKIVILVNFKIILLHVILSYVLSFRKVSNTTALLLDKHTHTIFTTLRRITDTCHSVSTITE